jgi:superfamily I DNA/RNA helicase
MNWRVSSLDGCRLVSSSDAHSPPMLGREATVLDTEVGYDSLRRALATGEGYVGTLEFFPEEGKYHLDGHRACGVRLSPEETRARQGICPVCGKPVTVGVMHRVEELADRPDGARAPKAGAFHSLVPLPEIVAEIHRVGAKSQAVTTDVNALVERLGPELRILQELPLETVRRSGSSLVAEAISRVREGKVTRDAGYDGEYGTIRVFQEKELGSGSRARSLFGEEEPATAGARGKRGRVKAPPAAPVTPSTVTAPLGIPPPAPPLASQVLHGLDQDQRAAAAVTSGALLVLAGPGTGKTRTLTHRLAHLVRDHGVAPESCLAITFTRRAAQEMRTRLQDLLPDVGERLLVTTFHGLGLRVLQEHPARVGLPEGFRVADDEERLEVARALPGRKRPAAQVLEELARHKHACPDQDADGELGVLQGALRAAGLVDLDDLVSLPVRLLSSDAAVAESYRDRWRHLSVDEYQDADALQYRLVRMLAPEHGSTCVIGDPDQAIYGFRGADVGHFLRFQEDFPAARVVSLTRNYRSSSTIVTGALQAIAPATLVPGRELHAVAGPAFPAPIAVHQARSERAEAEFVVATLERLLGGWSHFSLDSGRSDGGVGEGLAFCDVAVLYRTDAQASPLVEALARSGIPFQKRSHDRLVDRPGVSAILETLRHAGPTGEEVAALTERVVGLMPENNGSVEEKAELAAARDLLLPVAARHGRDLRGFLAEVAMGAEVDVWDPRADRVSLLTLHAAKGLEFPVVFLVGCEDGLLPLRLGGRAAGVDQAEERRLFFVGMTRAKRRLYLTWSRQRTRHGQVVPGEPSPFIRDIDQRLREEVHATVRGRRQAAGAQLSLL